MSDVIELDEGHTIYHIYGLRTRGEEILVHANRLHAQLEERGAAANAALADFEGPIAVQFHTSVKDVHGAVAVLARTVAAAAATCLNFPSPGSAPYPSTPHVVEPALAGIFSADPLPLRHFATATPEWDSVARQAGQAVDLNGVTATSTARRFVPDPVTGVPTEHRDPPVPIDPATLVSLPSAGTITAMVVTKSAAVGELAGLTANAVETADTPAGIFAWVRLLGFALALKQSAGLAPKEYADQLRDYWLSQAYERAGIDPDTWDPSLGAYANMPNIEAVYRYYGELYLAFPHLEWAGMANLIGASFAGGFLDLNMLRNFAHAAAGPEWLPTPLDSLPGSPVPYLEDLGNLTAEELRFYEVTFLQMQKDIFIDAAVMHEAYLSGGLPAIRTLRDAGIIDDAAVSAWALIHRGRLSGNGAQVSRGNTMLLDREQNQIIRDSYDDMYNRYPSGPAVTYAMTIAGQPSIPGAKSMADVYPLEVTVPIVPTDIGFTTPHRLGTPRSVLGQEIPSFSFGIPTLTVEIPETDFVVRTPLPDGNVASQNTRWRLIIDDTLPAYQSLLADDPDLARELIATPLSERIDDYRLERRIGPILHDLATDWDVYLDTDPDD